MRRATIGAANCEAALNNPPRRRRRRPAPATDRSVRTSHSESSELTTKPPAKASTLNKAARLTTMPRTGPVGRRSPASRDSLQSGNCRYSQNTTNPSMPYTTNMLRSAASLATFGIACQPVWHTSGEGSERGAQRTQHAIACKQCGSCVGARSARQARMLQGQEYAYSRRTGVEPYRRRRRPGAAKKVGNCTAREAHPSGGDQNRSA